MAKGLKGKARDRYRNSRKRETRALTISLSRATNQDRALRRSEEPDDGARRLPLVRGDCAQEERPCPYVSCRYHLFVDVDPRSGSAKLNFPDLFDIDGFPELERMKETCVLDVADREDATLEEVGELLNVTRERVRQLEVSAIEKLAALPTIVELRR
jgi:hypothetical protein